MESGNAHLIANTNWTTLSKEDKSFFFLHKAGPQRQMNYFTCCSLKNNNARGEKKNQSVLGEMAQYIQSMCAIFVGDLRDFSRVWLYMNLTTA